MIEPSIIFLADLVKTQVHASMTSHDLRRPLS